MTTKHIKDNTAPQLRRIMKTYTQSAEVLEALEAFRVMRQQIKRPLTVRGLQLIWTELIKLAGGSDAAKVAILEQSIMNSWRGVFPLKKPVRRAGQHGNTRPDGLDRDYGQSSFGALD